MIMLLKHFGYTYCGTVLIFIYLTRLACTRRAEAPEKTYVFAFSNDGFPANFVTKQGKLDGQSVRLVKKVCERAGKSCDTAVVPRRDCWDSSTKPALSKVLDENWFDACANLPPSSQRYMGYLATPVSYFRTPYPSLIVKPGSYITLDDLRSCNSLRLAFLDNLGLTPDCLFTSSYWVDESKFVRIPAESSLITGTANVVKAVLTGKADIGLVVTRFLNPKGVNILCTVPCSGDLAMGLNILMRKSSCALYTWWSAALLDFVCNDFEEYQRFCRSLAKDFKGEDPYCLTPGIDIDCNSADGVITSSRKIMRIEPCKKTYNPHPPTKQHHEKSTKSKSKSRNKSTRTSSSSSSHQGGAGFKHLAVYFGKVNNNDDDQQKPSSFGLHNSPLAAHFRDALDAKKKQLGQKTDSKAKDNEQE